MSELLVQVAIRSDCSEICRLIKAIFEQNNTSNAQCDLTPQALERDGFDCDPPLFKCLVVRDPENPSSLCAFALYYLSYHSWRGKTLHLEDIYVDEEFRKLGLASLILSQLVKEANDDGYSEIELCAFSWNSAANNLYKKFGFHNLSDEHGLNVWRLYKQKTPQNSTN